MHTKYRNLRSSFTPEEYEKYKGSRWFMPVSSGAGSPTLPLAEWRRAAGDGVASILPLLGLIARSKARENFALSAQEIARLVNIDAKTITTARKALENHGLVRSWPAKRHGVWLTHWSVSPALAAGGDGMAATGYFAFAIRLLHGGVWAMMPRVLRTLYLAAATRASSVIGPPEAHWLYRDLLHPDADRFDFERWHELTAGRATFRAAALTLRELSDLSGVSAQAVSAHIAALKHPRIWPESRALPRLLDYAPLWVYPTTARVLLFHFRDHVPHWPWDVLNRPDRDKLNDCELASLLPEQPEFYAVPPIDARGTLSGATGELPEGAAR